MGVSDAVRNPGSYVGEKQRVYRSLLFDPDTFYSEYAGKRGIVRELILVALVGVVGAIGTLYAVQALRGEYGGMLTNDVDMQLWGNALAPLVGAFLLWIGFTVALYAVSWLYSTAGSFYTLWKNTAWSLLPLLFANLILTVAYAVTTYTAEFDGTDELTSSHPDAIVAFMWEQLAHEPMVVGAYALSIVFVVWCGYIAAYGVAEVRDLETDEAYRVVAVPVVAYALYVGYTAIGTIL
ncbi:YIP1 family protein [Halobacteria archaeon AArc-m2/3/4]|uniref:YIP1 family protein n=1 Tax=Natronoglomus mannanivorans TaxID=2979990 RepID=A0AAP2YXS1_9EURY|nr:YIP1 family protein [Halobacteria archaeon AArc-xg1-1]MCU4972315.1 YIP1 family protein [Halobacteria archaeon AArc-m2/3/4]